MDTYTTRDMSLAAYLLVLDYEPLDEGWIADDHSYEWEFGPDVEHLIAAYYGGNALVDPRAHNNKIATIKRSIFA